jgi:hypothetical protein
LKSKEKIEDEHKRLDVDYKLSPGEYTVVGYLCGMTEGPECIKTNAITITVAALRAL